MKGACLNISPETGPTQYRSTVNYLTIMYIFHLGLCIFIPHSIFYQPSRQCDLVQQLISIEISQNSRLDIRNFWLKINAAVSSHEQKLAVGLH